MWLRIKLIFSAIGIWIFPLVKTLGSNVGQAVLKEAITVVSDVAVTMVTANDDVKRKAAFTKITANLKDQGLQNLETSVINAAIETAVIYMKSKE